ncbi:molybdopterin-dependent oxidoreductase [Bailinhaonella thermotolerans]|uniref:Oxidoreductase n=1 Tax=Bailinhaonella thermotolerans TaxID=1070861 RepID=A0A3A4A961_9ACTN|nr:molybdopterin-dependent oxidoreductase [Bailinhaonella thermotolerans]RJL24559.1 oxidoreductase [Bailinhaonella thermotolerans]
MSTRGSGRAWAALLGVVTGAVAIGVAQLAAGLLEPRAFPVLAVGDAVVDATPAPVKDWAIATFGVYDKIVLITGILLILAAIAAALGVLAARRLLYGYLGLAVFAVIGVVAALSRPDADPLYPFPTLAGIAAAALALRILIPRAAPRPPAVRHEPRPAGGSPEPTGTRDERHAHVAPDDPAPAVRHERAAAGGGVNRRGVLVGAVAGLGVAGVSGALGRALAGRLEVGAARSEVALPRAAVPAKALPAGADLRVPGLSPFVTPNQSFYRIDTALIVPQVAPGEWRLRVHGLVDRPLELTYADLLRRPMTEADVTLACVSNEVGGDLIGNARWLGAPLADLLREAGVRPGADMLLSTSADGWTCGTPVETVLDGRNALLAVAMNGEALPVRHGFPVRQVVPGLYGYVSATKWVVDIKVTRFAEDQAYWTPRGWAERAPIKTQSRIDVPRHDAKVKAGRVAVAGVAWAQHRGVDAVEVRIDGGEWRVARLAETPGPDTWRQWTLDWDAAPGRHRIEVRATDVTGHTQPQRRTKPAPDGAEGWHTITVDVTP